VRLEHERILVRTRGGERIKAPAEKLRAELRRCPDVERVLIRSKGEDVGTTPLMHISLEQRELKVERPTLFKWRAEYTYEVQASFKPYDRPREDAEDSGTSGERSWARLRYDRSTSDYCAIRPGSLEWLAADIAIRLNHPFSLSHPAAKRRSQRP
jgi:hypothetical protein